MTLPGNSCPPSERTPWNLSLRQSHACQCARDVSKQCADDIVADADENIEMFTRKQERFTTTATKLREQGFAALLRGGRERKREDGAEWKQERIHENPHWNPHCVCCMVHAVDNILLFQKSSRQEFRKPSLTGPIPPRCCLLSNSKSL